MGQQQRSESATCWLIGFCTQHCFCTPAGSPAPALLAQWPTDSQQQVASSMAPTGPGLPLGKVAASAPPASHSTGAPIGLHPCYVPHSFGLHYRGTTLGCPPMVWLACTQHPWLTQAQKCCTTQELWHWLLHLCGVLVCTHKALVHAPQWDLFASLCCT